jgi:hypothetical protein
LEEDAMRLPAEIQKSFPIEVEEGTFNVTFRQATEGDEMARISLFAVREEIVDVRNPNIITTHFDQNLAKLRAKEVYLTLMDCDLQKPSGRGLLFRPGMPEDQFMKAWGQLPPNWASEIYKHCLKVNRHWGPDVEEGEEEGEGPE